MQKMRLFSTLYFLLIAFSSLAQQSKENLEKERLALLIKIESTNDILKKTSKERLSHQGKLRILNSQIHQNMSLIKNINTELAMIEEDVIETNDILEALQKDLEDLKKEYSKMLYSSSKMNQQEGYQKLSFLLASKTMNQFLSRLNYFEQYQDTRKYQMNQIIQVKDMLEKKKIFLQERKEDRMVLLQTEKRQKNKLLALRKEQKTLFSQVVTKEEDLKTEIEKEKENFNNLNTLLAEIIANDLKKISTGEMGSDLFKLTPEAQIVSDSFQLNRSNLIWPVKKGFIAERFGKQPHPVLEKIWVENLGVDIVTSESEEVRAVFDGKVAAVNKVVGLNYVVTLQHGDYYTVYANVKNVSVRVGQYVKRKTALAKVVSNQSKIPELQFQIWHNQNRLDPELWLAH